MAPVTLSMASRPFWIYTLSFLSRSSKFSYCSKRIFIWNSSRQSIESIWKIMGTSSELASKHCNSLGDSTEEGHLNNSQNEDLSKSRKSQNILQNINDGVVFRKVKRSWEDHSKFLNCPTNKGHCGNTSTFDFNGTTVGEGCFIHNETKGIKKIKRTGINTKTIRGTRIGVQGSRVMFIETGTVWGDQTEQYRNQWHKVKNIGIANITTNPNLCARGFPPKKL